MEGGGGVLKSLHRILVTRGEVMRGISGVLESRSGDARDCKRLGPSLFPGSQATSARLGHLRKIRPPPKDQATSERSGHLRKIRPPRSLCFGLQLMAHAICRGQNVQKTSRRDLASVIARGGDGATTVSATMILAARAGISVFVTGGGPHLWKMNRTICTKSHLSLIKATCFFVHAILLLLKSKVKGPPPPPSRGAPSLLIISHHSR